MHRYLLKNLSPTMLVLLQFLAVFLSTRIHAQDTGKSTPCCTCVHQEQLFNDRNNDPARILETQKALEAALINWAEALPMKNATNLASLFFAYRMLYISLPVSVGLRLQSNLLSKDPLWDDDWLMAKTTLDEVYQRLNKLFVLDKTYETGFSKFMEWELVQRSSPFKHKLENHLATISHDKERLFSYHPSLEIFMLHFLAKSKYAETYFYTAFRTYDRAQENFHTTIDKSAIMDIIRQFAWHNPEVLKNPFFMMLKKIMDPAARRLDSQKNFSTYH